MLGGALAKETRLLKIPMFFVLFLLLAFVVVPVVIGFMRSSTRYTLFHFCFGMVWLSSGPVSV